MNYVNRGSLKQKSIYVTYAFAMGIILIGIVGCAGILGTTSQPHIPDLLYNGFKIEDVNDTKIADNAMCKAAKEFADARGYNFPFCLFINERGTLSCKPGVKMGINVKTGQYMFLQNDMFVNIGYKPLKIGGMLVRRGEIVLQKSSTPNQPELFEKQPIILKPE